MSRSIQLEAFCSPPHGDIKDAKMHLSCPVHVLACYPFGALNSCYGERLADKAISKKHIVGFVSAPLNLTGRWVRISHCDQSKFHTWYSRVNT